MKAFAELFQRIDQTNSTNEKVHLMEKFFSDQSADNAAWALYLLTGRRPKKHISSRKLRIWLNEVIDLPEWLLEDCYSAVGDTAEMVSLIMGDFSKDSTSSLALRELSLSHWMTELILPLIKLDEQTQRETVVQWWRELQPHEIFIVNKFMTGALRVGVSETLVYRALENIFKLPRSVIASRLLGDWKPSGEFFKNLSLPPDPNAENDESREVLPKPFCLAAPLEGHPRELGAVSDWIAEWKWDGIRSQIVKFGERVEIWSRGEERITHAFPDLAEIFSQRPGDWILDGEIVAGPWHTPALFQELQKRLNRKKPPSQFLKDNPVSFIIYDYLVEERQDLTSLPLRDRLDLLERKVNHWPQTDRYGISNKLNANDWQDLEHQRSEARLRGAEGLMLKHKDSIYETGRKRGVWFKWKLDPLTVDAVLTSAQPGTGRRASLYTDYTFSIWKGDQLVPIAKAYSGLTDAEIRELDQWIRKNTVERFGPVRALKNEKVYEIGFEGLAKSTRHKSGFAVRFPRILRERIDKKPDAADRVEDMEKLLEVLQERGV